MRTATAISVLLILGGCVQQNERLTIGNNLPVEAVSDRSESTGVAAVDDAPSVAGADRSHWGTVDYLVPVDGVAHRPTYASRYKILKVTARQRLEHPTVESALELDGRPDGFVLGEEITEAAAGPVVAALDGVLLVPRMVVDPPWSLERSPLDSPERYPRTAVARP